MYVCCGRDAETVFTGTSSRRMMGNDKTSLNNVWQARRMADSNVHLRQPET